MRIIPNLLATVFILAAALQFDDPDPVYWVAVYTGTALVLMSHGLGRYSEFWTAVLIGAVVAGMIGAGRGFFSFLLSGDLVRIFYDMAQSSAIEDSREFLGLTIALVSLLYSRAVRSKSIACA